MSSILFWTALLSAVGCALCNGIAAVLQKVSADKEARATTLQASLFFKLLQDWPYLLGTTLDGLAWILTLIAVHSLPLFVVQPIIAFSVVITALVERFAFKRVLNRQGLIAIGLIVAGLLLLAITAAPETAQPVGAAVRWVIIVAPVLIAAAGAVCVRIQKDYAVTTMAALSGLGFGGTAVVGRMLSFELPYWRILISPLFISLVAYGLVGILLFTIALQRQRASVVNATMITFETLAPIVIGLLFLGDHPRSGLWIIMVIGGIVAVTGTLLFTNTATKKQ
jgi:drug/metabolite transporter (DMT)-like permease